MPAPPRPGRPATSQLRPSEPTTAVLAETVRLWPSRWMLSIEPVVVGGRVRKVRDDVPDQPGCCIVTPMVA